MKHLYWKIGAVLLIILACVGGYMFFGGNLAPQDIPEDNEDDWIRGAGRINILLLGTDSDMGNESRTDTIILASVDTEQKKLSILSIPRDTRVNIPGYGDNRINAANQIGGVELVKETISELLKVPIDYYVLTNFDGFIGIIDILGGVEIDVEQNMKCRVYDGVINLEKGIQRLDGEKALQYVRFRYDKLGDISRTQRQQKFLVALAKEMMQAKNVVKLPALIPQIQKTVETDLTLPQLLGLARDGNNYDLDNITVQTLPGNFATINGGSYWVVDMDKTPEVVLSVFAGQNENIIDESIQVVKTEKPKPPKKPLEDAKAEQPDDNDSIIPEGGSAPDNSDLPGEEGLQEEDISDNPPNDGEPEDGPTETPPDNNTPEPPPNDDEAEDKSPDAPSEDGDPTEQNGSDGDDNTSGGTQKKPGGNTDQVSS
ncbi:MAG: LCP family protein [Desulfitobacteriaceae bacterium]|nr:LCP family protein [Desulfitobacteriaceae bacterium]